MSKARRLSVLLLALAMFIVAPTASAQCTTCDNPNESTPTTLYFHIFDTVNRFVINTQAMESETFEVGGANFMSTPDFGIEDPGTGLPTEEGWDLNTIYGYSTAGPVEYGFIENGRPRYHPERGIAARVNIDDQGTNAACEEAGAAVPACVFIYIEPRDAVGTSDAPTLSPVYTVRLTLQEGDDPGLDANLDAGKDIMTGQTTFHMADAKDANSGAQSAPGEDPNGNKILYPDADGYIQVLVPLDIHQNYIPKKEAYNVRVDWFQNPDQTGQTGDEYDDQFSNGWMRLGIDPTHLPRLEMNVMNPIYFSFIHPQVAANTLLIHAGGNSPWGTYDVDLDNIGITVTHVQSGKVVPDSQLKKILNSNEHVHGLHDEDAQFTYLWDFRDFDAALGEYSIAMTVTNDRGNTQASGTASFKVTETEAIGFDTEGNEVESTNVDEVVDTPAVGILPALGLLGAALVLARKRLQS